MATLPIVVRVAALGYLPFFFIISFRNLLLLEKKERQLLLSPCFTKALIVYV